MTQTAAQSHRHLIYNADTTLHSWRDTIQNTNVTIGFKHPDY